MRIAGLVLGGLAIVALLAAFFIRRVDHDPDRWHVDPLTAEASSGNSHRVAPAGGDVAGDAASAVYDRPVAELAADFDRIAQGSRRVEVVAGSAADGFVTYVQRSWFFGFPDYVSVRFIAVDTDASTLAVLSRSRFGGSDFGVNERRVERWLSQLDETE